ncbi:hypothetical protein FPQ18DRAFT_48792 [Pyronema domesticum]|nr:hypothetical protein FPQ18DRAFT_48792 [Pyronema domesticum]
MHWMEYLFHACGRLKEAQEIQEKMLEVRRHTLGEEHPDTLTALEKRTLGEEHPDTLRSMESLAITYEELGGRLKEAQEFREKVLEARRCTLGEDHGDPAGAMYDLALTLHNLERLDEAISLMEDAACSYVRIYGSDHSETKDTERVAKQWKDEIKQDDRGADSTYREGVEDSDEAAE